VTDARLEAVAKEIYEYTTRSMRDWKDLDRSAKRYFLSAARRVLEVADAKDPIRKPTTRSAA
jgi:hypothetical protein